MVTISTQDSAKLLRQLESGFERKISGKNINQKCQQYLDHLIDPTFQKKRAIEKHTQDIIFQT